jgi:ORF6N domain-containing protein
MIAIVSAHPTCTSGADVTPNPQPLPTTGQISERFVVIRGHKVILDPDLAAIYGVPTKRLNQQVRRNPERFPPDFVFLLRSPRGIPR